MGKTFGKKHHIYAALVKKERHMIRNVRAMRLPRPSSVVVLGNPNVGKMVTEAIAPNPKGRVAVPWLDLTAHAIVFGETKR
jgi:hypothetical protein